MMTNGFTEYTKELLPFRTRGVQTNRQLLASLTEPNIKANCINIARQLIGDEIRDIGGDLYKGGKTFDEYKLKVYTRNVLDSYYPLLRTTNGGILYDIPHLAVAAEAMYNGGRSADDVKRVYGISALTNMGYIVNSVQDFKAKARGGVLKTIISSTNFECKTIPSINNRYMMYFTMPSGYNCFVYEPQNIVQLAFLNKVIGMDGASAGSVLSNTNRGLLIQEISLQTENQFARQIYGAHFATLTGYYKQNFFSLYNNSLSDLSLRDIYASVLTPTMCEMMYGFLRILNGDIANAGLLSSDCYINHITPSRLSFCLKNTYNIVNTLPNVCKLVKYVQPENFSLLNILRGIEF